MTGTSYRATIFGCALALLVCVVAWAAPAAFASDAIYWTSYTSAGAVRLGDLGGGGAHDLVTGESSPDGLAIDPAAGKIYWANTTSGTIRVANLDGTGARDLYTGESSPSGVAIDPATGLIYWANAVSRSGTSGCPKRNARVCPRRATSLRRRAGTTGEIPPHIPRR